MPRGVYLHKSENYPPSRKGARLTEEQRKRMSERLKGNTWNRGRKHSKESTRLKKVNSARYWLGKTGKRHGHWKEVKITPLYLQVRSCFQYRQWRWDIYTRDNFACVLCGKHGKEVSGKLEADHFPKTFAGIFSEYHIKTYDEAIACEELWNINNGRTLCVECHRKCPTSRRRKKQ